MNKWSSLFTCLLPLIMISISGCASLKTQVFNDIHEGDSKDHVISLLGEPQYFQKDPASGLTVYSYRKRSDLCSIALINNKVSGTSCEKISGYVSPAAAMLSGMGKSLQDGSRRPAQQFRTTPTTCTSSAIGDQVYTNCN